MHNQIINNVVTLYKLVNYWLQKLQMIQQHSYICTYIITYVAIWMYIQSSMYISTHYGVHKYVVIAAMSGYHAYGYTKLHN